MEEIKQLKDLVNKFVETKDQDMHKEISNAFIDIFSNNPTQEDRTAVREQMARLDETGYEF